MRGVGVAPIQRFNLIFRNAWAARENKTQKARLAHWQCLRPILEFPDEYHNFI